MKKLFVLWGICIFSLLSFSAHAETISTQAVFSVPLPIQINEGEQVFGLVDFGKQFDYIEQVTFRATFVGDMLSATDQIVILFPTQVGDYIVYMGISNLVYTGIVNFPQMNSYDTYSLTSSSLTLLKDALMDGSTDFYIMMISGSVGLRDASIEITGAVVPEPNSFVFLFTGGVVLAGRNYLKRKKKA